MMAETKKILDPAIKLTATCVRVPVFISHSESVNALFTQAQAEQMRLITGLCLMDRHAPAQLLNRSGVGTDATEQSLLDAETLIHRWPFPL